MAQINIDYQKLYNEMVINPADEKRIDQVVHIINQGKQNYLQVCQNIPWYLVGILHYRECSCSFGHHLHNGDPLARRTVHVPVGRPIHDPLGGPGQAYNWVESAKDALEFKGLYQHTDWSLQGTLYLMEEWNGFGYFNHGVNSPYIWGGTSNYQKGCFVADHVFDPNVVDHAIGAAPLLKLLSEQ